MGQIRLACPGCRQPITCSEENRGHQVRCPRCQEVITVPQAVGRPAASTQATVPDQPQDRSPPNSSGGHKGVVVIAGMLAIAYLLSLGSYLSMPMPEQVAQAVVAEVIARNADVRASAPIEWRQ